MTGMAALPQVAAQDLSLSDGPVRVFAFCAGRLSALMEHQWLTDGPASEATRELRDEMLTLVAAVAAPEEVAAVLGWRVEAKAAHAALLSQAAFATDADVARRARMRAANLAADCTSLVAPRS